MLDDRRTQIGATDTAEGRIPHLYRGGILLPVKLEVANYSVRGVMHDQYPQRDNGRLVYALPGGGSICP